ncbi:MAG TPA: hypothetical protein VE981_15825 [Planctomycetota bacterium]|nr:hypothetical protein [Planctomycetota bacterium]
MPAKKPSKKSKTLGRKTLKRTKGGLLPAVNIGNSQVKTIKWNPADKWPESPAGDIHIVSPRDP